MKQFSQTMRLLADKRPLFWTMFSLSIVSAASEIWLHYAFSRIVGRMASDTGDAASGVDLFWVLPVLFMLVMIIGFEWVRYRGFMATAPSSVRKAASTRLVAIPIHALFGKDGVKTAGFLVQLGTSVRNFSTDIVSLATFFLVQVTFTGLLFVNVNLWFLVPIVTWAAAILISIHLTLQRIRQGAKEVATSSNRLLARISNVASNLIQLRIFARDGFATELIAREIDRDQAYNVRQMSLVASVLTFIYLMNGVFLLATGFLMTHLWQTDTMSIADLALISSLSLQLSSLAVSLMWKVQNFAANGGRVSSAADNLGLHQDIPPNVAWQDSNGPLGLSARGLRVESGGKAILEYVTIDLEGPSFVGIVGASGAGKTTLVHALSGVLEPSGGQIELRIGSFVPGAAMDPFDIAIGLHSQDTKLLHASVRDNVLMGREDVPQARIDDTLVQLGLADRIVRLRDAEGRKGLDAVFDPSSAVLSGGERQRLLIARILLSQKSILLLDEATSALDYHSVQKVMALLADAAQTRLVMITTHRRDYLSAFDQVIFIENGRIVAQGSHDQLMQSSLPYQKHMKNAS